MSPQNYDYRFVALSLLIAVLAAYVALDLAGRIAATAGRARYAWLTAGAVAMAIGAWTMRYVGHGSLLTITFHWSALLLAVGVAMALRAAIAMPFARRLALQEQQIATNRLQLESLFDHMIDGVVVIDLQGTIVQINPAACHMLGLEGGLISSDESTRIFDVLYPGGERVPLDQWPGARARRGEFLNHQELLICRRDTGKTVAAEITTSPISAANGNMAQFLITYRDITEQRQHVDTRARLAAIVESSEDAIIGKDDKGIVQTWNAAAERIFGYTAEEMVGQSILKLIPRDRQQEELDFMARIQHGESIDQIETTHCHKSGKPFYVSLTISPIRDRNGKVIGASKIVRDISERKKMERQLQQSQKMEAIGQLTGGIAHDFNNLLGVVVGNLSLIEHLVGDNPVALKRVHTAQKAAARGADLTRRLLAFSSSEELNPAPTVLANSIRNTIELASRAMGPDVRIIANLDETIPLVFVDPAGLESALLNLVVNARDAMPGGGTITITTTLTTVEENYAPVKTGELKPGRYALVSVTDTGEGMSRETMERALEPFFTTKLRGKGTGLGLAMVYGFVKQSGGILLLYSELGYGTTISFYLHIAHEGAVLHTLSPEPVSLVNQSGKVLVVDDEADLLDIAVEYLAQMGLTAFHAIDGVSALEIITREQDIALVVTDVVMPGMNGVELVKRIRQLQPDIKVIYSSGFPADALAERSGTTVDGLLLKKPYQRAEFDAIVRDTLQSSEQAPHRPRKTLH